MLLLKCKFIIVFTSASMMRGQGIIRIVVVLVVAVVVFATFFLNSHP